LLTRAARNAKRASTLADAAARNAKRASTLLTRAARNAKRASTLLTPLLAMQNAIDAADARDSRLETRIERRPTSHDRKGVFAPPPFATTRLRE